ncbi:MAG TPA: PAS domain S-box protein, partial [Alphaproteobacteria bacterium]|nr:PAS domain S-box protein [Alphaproteobacteria bacterium]
PAALAGRDGRPIGYFTFSWTPLRDDSGAVAGLLCNGLETTARVETDRAFRRVFEASPTPLLVVAPDPPHFTVRHANDSLLAATMRTQDRVIGRPLFEAYPANPGDPEATGVGNLRAALERTLATKNTVALPVQKYDIALPDGSFDERWWQIANSPVLSATGEVEAIIHHSTDVTDRHRIEERLHESEARFRNMADHAPLMMWVTEADGRCTYLNRAWYRFTGQSHEEAIGFGWLDTIHPEDRQRANEVFEAASAAQSAFQVEYRLRRADGVYRWAIDAAAPRLDEGGRFLGYIGSVIDITERRDAEERLRAATNALPAFVWFAGPDGQLHHFNDRWYEYTGQTPEQALPNGWVDMLHPDDVERTAIAWADARARGVTYGIEVRYRRRDGVYRWYVARAEPLRDAVGAIVAWVGTSSDIDDRRRAEEGLQRLNATLEQRVADALAERKVFSDVVEGSAAAIMVLDLNYQILATNRANIELMERLHGRRPRVGGNLLELFADRPAHRAKLRETWGRAFAGEEFLMVDEFGEGSRGQGTFEVRFGILRDREGRQIGASHTIYDISDRVRAQAELEVAQEALRQSQKLEAIGQLTGGVAHDFNNLLTVIRSSADLLRRPGLPEDRRARYIDAIASTAERAAKLTGQLLAFARRQALRPEVFDAAERVRSVLDMLRSIVGSRIEIRIEADAADFHVEADPTQFDTALVNLAVNARDAMAGEGTLAIAVERAGLVPPVRGHAAAAGDFVRVTIADGGVGIPPDLLDRIFEPFFTTKEVGQGTGLGLSQVFGFVKQSGGEVVVDSRPGEGAAFALYLPRVPAPGAAGLDRPAAAEQRPHQGRVLVVEDNTAVGTFAAQLLEELGYDAVWAANAQAALDVLAGGGRFDLVFTDVVMPGMSGIELAKLLRARYPALPVVLTSGYSHVLAQEGAHGFELLHKPYSVEGVSAALRRGLGA